MKIVYLFLGLILLISSGCSISISESSNSIKKQELNIFVNDLSNYCIYHKSNDLNYNLSIDKLNGYNYKIYVDNIGKQDDKSCLYGKFNIIDRNDGTFVFMHNALTRSDFGSQMRKAEIFLIKYNDKYYYWLSILVQNKKVLSIVNIVFPIESKDSFTGDIINALDQYPKEIGKLIENNEVKCAVHE